MYHRWIISDRRIRPSQRIAPPPAECVLRWAGARQAQSPVSPEPRQRTRRVHSTTYNGATAAAASSPFTFASFTGHDEIHSPRKQIRSSIQPMASLRPNPTGHPLLFRAPRMLQRLVHCMLHCMLHCIMAVGIEASVGYLALHACHGSRYASQRESGAPCAARSTSLLFTGRRRRRQAAMPPP